LEADAISFYFQKFLKFWRLQTPYGRRWEQLWHDKQQAEEW